MISKVFIVLVVVAVVAGDQSPSYRPPAPSYGAQDTQGPARYDFQWLVKDDPSGNYFGHQESRDDQLTQGHYAVTLPDGRHQRVDYIVNGDSGFLAEVQYEEEHQYGTQ